METKYLPIAILLFRGPAKARWCGEPNSPTAINLQSQKITWIFYRAYSPVVQMVLLHDFNVDNLQTYLGVKVHKYM